MHAVAVVEARRGRSRKVAQAYVQRLKGTFQPSFLKGEAVLVDKAVIGELALGHSGVFYYEPTRQHGHEHVLVELVKPRGIVFQKQAHRIVCRKPVS